MGLAIRDIAVAVPKTVRDLSHWGPAAAKLTAATGIRERRVVVQESITDLFAAAGRAALGHRCAVDAIVVVTQTPDRRIPPVANVLCKRLGIMSPVIAFDVNQGCSGYVYGLAIAAGLAKAGSGRILLLAGDCLSTVTSLNDRATEPLFGDACSATYLERCDDAPPIRVSLGSDGSGCESLTLGIDECDTLKMDGPAVFEFANREVPPAVAGIMAEYGVTLDDIDAVVPHQPNALMLEHLRQKCGVPAEKWVSGVVGRFGNVSSASIPLALVLYQTRGRLLLAGFGGGWSWGTALVDTSETRIHPLVEV